jgi:DNA helicase-2/ATP-dependent DNA helicase PcrA
MQLSPQQQAAVEHTGSPALVVAGAGSGKTRTLTAKFAHLVQIGHAAGTHPGDYLYQQGG